MSQPDLDDVLDMMRNTKVYCRDENSEILQKAVETEVSLMQNFNITIKHHQFVQECLSRYAYYGKHLKFKGDLEFIGRLIKEFNGMYIHQNIWELITLAYFIDTQILFAVGNLCWALEDPMEV